MTSGNVPFLVRMGPVWQPVYLRLRGRLAHLCNSPCTHVDADQDLPPRVVRLHVHATGEEASPMEAREDGALGEAMADPARTADAWARG
jgi:hypothetical protein